MKGRIYRESTNKGKGGKIKEGKQVRKERRTEGRESEGK